MAWQWQWLACGWQLLADWWWVVPSVQWPGQTGPTIRSKIVLSVFPSVQPGSHYQDSQEKLNISQIKPATFVQPLTGCPTQSYQKLVWPIFMYLRNLACWCWEMFGNILVLPPPPPPPPPLYLLPSSTQLWKASSIKKQGAVESQPLLRQSSNQQLPYIIYCRV